MTMDVNHAVQLMLAAMKPVFGKWWNDVEQFAVPEAKKLAELAASIVAQRKAGAIDNQEASLLLEMEKDAVAAVFAAVRGISEEAAREAVLAGLGALKDPINKELGFSLLQ